MKNSIDCSNDKKPMLWLTIGLPRSGKTTWIWQNLDRWGNASVVNPDSIRVAMHGEAFNPAAETAIWMVANYMVPALFVAGHDNVILDATNINKSQRVKWQPCDLWDVGFVYFEIEKSICLQRASEEMKPVIESMSDRFAPFPLLPVDIGWQQTKTNFIHLRWSSTAYQEIKRI
ncbi:MAG: AAA family ATPase [Cyanobacteria bacterium P01_E01_bin.6]